jgi:hypothetical protein
LPTPVGLLGHRRPEPAASDEADPDLLLSHATDLSARRGRVSIAILNGRPLCSTDAGFSRFPKLRWRNPLDCQTPPTAQCWHSNDQHRHGGGFGQLDRCLEGRDLDDDLAVGAGLILHDDAGGRL